MKKKSSRHNIPDAETGGSKCTSLCRRSFEILIVHSQVLIKLVYFGSVFAISWVCFSFALNPHIILARVKVTISLLITAAIMMGLVISESIILLCASAFSRWCLTNASLSNKLMPYVMELGEGPKNKACLRGTALGLAITLRANLIAYFLPILVIMIWISSHDWRAQKKVQPSTVILSFVALGITVLTFVHFLDQNVSSIISAVAVVLLAILM